MGKYSSDSDSEKRSKSSYKSRTKRRSSSSSSSESRNRKHKKKSDRSRSRDKYSSSRRSQSGSSVAHKSKSRRRSRSKEKLRHRDRHHRSRSRSKYRRSRSRSYIREYSSKVRRRSSSNSSDSEPKHESNVEENVMSEARKSPETSKIDPKSINAINEDGFAPKPFTSSKSKKMMDNIVIDLKKQTIKVPEVEPVEPDSVFHHNLFLNEEARMEKWIKELYGYRQRALQQGLKAGEKDNGRL